MTGARVKSRTVTLSLYKKAGFFWVLVGSTDVLKPYFGVE